MRCLPVTFAALLALAGCAGDVGLRPPAAAVPGVLPSGAPSGPESAESWFRAGHSAALARGAGRRDARNLVLFLGDGMGPTTVAAARILHGQLAGANGEEAQLAFERFPALALAKTYNTDAQTPDSAGTMTAIASGVKTRIGVIGLDQSVSRGRCAGIEAASQPSLIDMARQAGLATGIVTTTRITHATPAALYAHSPERDWESDAQMPAQARAAGCLDIAAQLVERQRHAALDVVLGGGRGMFRSGGRDLLQTWRTLHPHGHLPTDRAALMSLPDDGAPVFGLFAEDHFSFELDREAVAPGEPSLAEMTRVAIARLQAGGRPYVLVVEGGRIDHAHHFGQARRALVETLAFAEAVEVADRTTSVEDTLLVVTADHSHALSFVGYPARGNPILGLVRTPKGELARDRFGRPYTTLSYANGPGAELGLDRLEDSDTTAADFRQPALVPLADETHGGEDVAVYARGPGSEAVRGSIEQHVVFHLLSQAQPALRAAVQRRLANWPDHAE